MIMDLTILRNVPDLQTSSLEETLKKLGTLAQIKFDKLHFGWSDKQEKNNYQTLVCCFESQKDIDEIKKKTENI